MFLSGTRMRYEAGCDVNEWHLRSMRLRTALKSISERGRTEEIGGLKLVFEVFCDAVAKPRSQENGESHPYEELAWWLLELTAG